MDKMPLNKRNSVFKFIIRMVTVKEIFKNCLSVADTPRGLLPLRFTERQFDVYARKSELLALRSRCAASVCLSFYTQRESLSFSYYIAAFARKTVVFDIYENDVMTATIQQPDESESGRIVYTKQHPGRTKITIYLPPCAEIYISDLDIEPYEPAPDRQKRLLFLGDSITQGMTSIGASLIYATLLADALDCAALNQGVGSYIFDEDSLDEGLPFAPDAIYVAYGTNDYSGALKNGIEPFLRKCPAYLSGLARIFPGVPVYVQTPIPRLNLETDEQIALFTTVRAYIAETAQSLGMNVIDGYRLIPGQQMYYTDRVHPNELGFLVYAMNLEKHIVLK